MVTLSDGDSTVYRVTDFHVSGFELVSLAICFMIQKEGQLKRQVGLKIGSAALKIDQAFHGAARYRLRYSSSSDVKGKA